MSPTGRPADDAAGGPASNAASRPSSAFTGCLFRWGPAAIVYGLFLLSSAIQAPVPGVNEPQYLGKAKHYWDPTWAAGDFFLDSSNPHLVFYLAVGWLTRFLTLDATAWVARAAGYAVVAVGWTMLAGRVARSRWAAVPAAAIFLLLASIGNFSGEWLVGGIEGKVFAYGLLFAAIALRLDDRHTAAAACLGGAVSFHPVVGMWGVVCGAVAELFQWGRNPDSRIADIRRLAIPACLFFVAALPGLVPAVLTLDGAAPAESSRATYLQVFVRLKHHLDPTEFAAVRYAGYALLLFAWLGLERLLMRRSSGKTPSRRDDWFRVFVLTSVAAAIVGVAVGWHGGSAWAMPLRDLRGTLLKFYPFRLADLFVPLAFSMAMARWLCGIGQPGTHRVPMRRVVASIVVTLAAFAASLAIASPDRNPSRLPSDRLADWLDVARWARNDSPPGSVFITPRGQWGFKWFAHRAEYVNFKDAPQDAAGLLEWERRLETVKRWWESSRDGRYSDHDLRRLGDRTGAAYLVTLADADRFASRPVYENRGYRVYGLK